MAPTELSGDALALVGILAWAKDAGLEVSAVTVGACHVELQRAPSAAPARKDEEPVARPGIYDQFGGPALQYVSEIPAGELQPAIGRQTR
jgi:hypothetical protein